MENLLLQAAAELNTRSEVESTLKSILQDVEHAHTLENSLHTHNELNNCKEQLNALTVRYEDREAAWESDRREKERLGMLFMEEIVKLSAREVKGEKSRREMELRLMQLENEKKSWIEARKSSSSSSSSDNTQVSQQPSARQSEKIEAVADEEDTVVQQPEIPDQQQTTTVESSTDKKIQNSTKETIISDTSEAKVTEEREGDGTPRAANSTIKEGDNTTPKDEQQKEEEPTDEQLFVPHKLDEETLMVIFAYLDPLDVMSFAQTNKALLKKVNIMFGMVDNEGDNSNADQQTQVQQQQAGKPSEGDEQVEATAAQPAVTTKSETITPSSLTNSTPKTSPKTSPKLGGIAGPTHKRQGSSTSIATQGTTGSAGTAIPSLVSSWFGAGASGAADSSSVASTAPTTTAESTTADSGSEIKLNAAMANSMASKLTPAELSIILRMREKLQKCETDANKWRLEKEDAMANLASVEAVKEFLVARVRDTERVVQTQKEEMRAIEKKNLEDQEVIVFLDERVKELEKSVNDMKSKESDTKQEAQDVVKKNEKKARVLSDMLRFEREQIAANEKEWKSAKKVLIKEVKSCRARIVALEAEVDGTSKQNKQLKNGLLSLQQSPGGNGRNKKFNY